MLTPKRKQELSLGAAGGIVGTLAVVAVLVTRAVLSARRRA
jgi:hypothetical protein